MPVLLAEVCLWLHSVSLAKIRCGWHCTKEYVMPQKVYKIGPLLNKLLIFISSQRIAEDIKCKACAIAQETHCLKLAPRHRA